MRYNSFHECCHSIHYRWSDTFGGFWADCFFWEKGDEEGEMII